MPVMLTNQKLPVPALDPPPHEECTAKRSVNVVTARQANKVPHQRCLRLLHGMKMAHVGQRQQCLFVRFTCFKIIFLFESTFTWIVDYECQEEVEMSGK